MALQTSDVEVYLSKIGQQKNERGYGRTIGIHSPARTGKTLLAVFLVIYYLERLDYLKGVISNVVLNLESIGRFDDYLPLKNIKNIKKEEYKNYIILTDEFRRLIDARMSGSFKNRFISNLLADTGKFRQVHILTDQEASSIDKRIRRNADAILVPAVNFQTGLCRVITLPNYDSYFRLDAYGLLDSYNDPKTEFSFEFRKYYRFFDTEQPIDEYVITFEPEDYLELLLEWMKSKGYDKRQIPISKGLLVLWKEQTGVEITSEQLSALMVYLYLEHPELNVDYRGKKKNDTKS